MKVLAHSVVNGKLHPKLLVNEQEQMRLETWSRKYGSVGVSSVMHFGLEKYKSHT